MLNKIKTYILNIFNEMKKVSWPTRNELVNSTIVVIIISVIVAAIVGLLDFIFTTGLTAILRPR